MTSFFPSLYNIINFTMIYLTESYFILDFRRELFLLEVYADRQIDVDGLILKDSIYEVNSFGSSFSFYFTYFNNSL